MVVPTVLAIIARRNWARWSASGNGVIVMSNVVLLLLLRPYRLGPLRNALRSPSTEVDEGIDVSFLVAGCAVIARWRPCRLREAESWIASGAYRAPSRERTSLMTRSCKPKA